MNRSVFTENGLTIRNNSTEIGNIIQGSNNMYLSVLDALGLPTDDILSSVDERRITLIVRSEDLI